MSVDLTSPVVIEAATPAVESEAAALRTVHIDIPAAEDPVMLLEWVYLDGLGAPTGQVRPRQYDADETVPLMALTPADIGLDPGATLGEIMFAAAFWALGTDDPLTEAPSLDVAAPVLGP